MKRVSVFMLTVMMIVTMLSGCSASLPEGMNGADAARLLLARERLDMEALESNGSIFDNGVETMNKLASKAMANLGVRRAAIPVTAAAPLLNRAAKVLKGDYIGQVEVGDSTFTWSNFEENNNSYEYFKNITGGIVSSAEMAAELIDNIKKNVRVVDKWVKMDNTKLFLHVDENAELLCEWTEEHDILKVCRRYKNDDGDDVYELYHSGNDYEERMTYIPDKCYERSERSASGNQYFVANNSKGYWETFVVGGIAPHYNLSFFIMKNDICYDAFYNAETKSLQLLKVMSADKKTDIMWFTEHEGGCFVNLQFAGFDGIESVVAPASEVEYTENEYANLPNGLETTIKLTNGKEIHYEDTFADGKGEVREIHVTYGADGYTGDVGLFLREDSREACLTMLKEFLDDKGLTCRRNLNTVFSAISRAYVELGSIIRYYCWNGISVVDTAGVTQATKVEDTRFQEMKSLYEAVKDAEVVDFNDTKAMAQSIHFAPITAIEAQGVVLDGGRISTGTIALTIEDTLLCVEGEPYRVALALTDKAGDVIHLPQTNETTTVYTEADKGNFTVSTLGVEAELPLLAAGDYTLVAYIATSDGIRSTACVSVPTETVMGMPFHMEGVQFTAKTDDKQLLTLTYTDTLDVKITLAHKESVNYATFHQQVAELVMAYGVPADSCIEVRKEGGNYVPLTGKEKAIESGIYRLTYSVKNGTSLVEGAVYVDYTVG